MPLILQNSYRPDGWLGFILGSKIYIDFTKYSFEECSSRLQKELKNIHDDHTALSTMSNKSAAIKKELENKSIASPSTATMSRSWSQEQVINYFKSKNINDSIIEILPCDGMLLEHLYQTLEKAPEFLFKQLFKD